MKQRIDLSEVIANGDAYCMDAPLEHYEMLARKIQLLLGDKVALNTRHDEKECQFWLTDRIALEPILLSSDGEEVYLYDNKMYVAEHSSGDEPTIGHYYYGTLYPSLAVVADGIEVGRATDLNAVCTLAVDAVVCSIAKPVPPKKRKSDPSLN